MKIGWGGFVLSAGHYYLLIIYLLIYWLWRFHIHLFRVQLPREGNAINWLCCWGFCLHFNLCLALPTAALSLWAFVLHLRCKETSEHFYFKPKSTHNLYLCPLQFGVLPCHRGDRYAWVMAAWRAAPPEWQFWEQGWVMEHCCQLN